MADVEIQLDPGAAQFQSTAFPALTKAAGTNFPVVGLAYDAAADESAYWLFRAINYASGDVTVQLDWYADTATSGDVIFGVQLACITPNTDTQDVETKAFAAATTVTDTHLGTTGQRVHRAPSVTVTGASLDSLTADDDVWIKVYRDADAAGDTLAGDVILLGATVSYLSS